MAPTIKSVELRTGISVPYAEQGNPSGIPMLLLHGYADSWRSVENVLPHLPPLIHAFAPSQRGHGDADQPTNGYSPQGLAADVLAFMDALNIDAAVIVGASSGGMIALPFVLDYPERTLALVLAGAPTTLKDIPNVHEFLDLVSQLSDPIDPTFVREFQQSTLVQPVPSTFLDRQVQESLKLPARVWKSALEPLLEADFTEELRKIEVPTLIIWGDKDGVLPREQIEAVSAAIRNSRLIIYSGAGHAFYWEESARFATDLASFAEYVPPPRHRRGLP